MESWLLCAWLVQWEDSRMDGWVGSSKTAHWLCCAQCMQVSVPLEHPYEPDGLAYGSVLPWLLAYIGWLNGMPRVQQSWLSSCMAMGALRTNANVWMGPAAS
jgi:hypothetical protein